MRLAAFLLLLLLWTWFLLEVAQLNRFQFRILSFHFPLPLSPSSIQTLQLQFRFLCCLSSTSICVCVCVVAGFSLIFSVLCTLCTHFPSPPSFHALPLLLLLLTIVVQGHIANVFVLLFRLVFMSLFLFICFLSTRKALCSHCAQCS